MTIPKEISTLVIALDRMFCFDKITQPIASMIKLSKIQTPLELKNRL